MNLEICYCLSTTNNNNKWSCYERIGYNSIVCLIELETRMKIKRLRMLWRKIKRENTLHIWLISNMIQAPT
ncbi:hypothetical protein Lalb_Chr25g0279751 [Lupinus albus]|uniref:Uncharacterized protein n=1 Tax=Lupinus albus TaxID=3870 RepID=A0A6A4MX78_LUPAL|nr:hypothetical protein Lalb_Chr25g0279751 [Lupinus albus]